MDQLCAAARVSKRTAYQHFTGKDELVAEYLRRFDPTSCLQCSTAPTSPPANGSRQVALTILSLARGRGPP